METEVLTLKRSFRVLKNKCCCPGYVYERGENTFLSDWWPGLFDKVEFIEYVKSK